jgi:hypothetical protein
MLKLSEPLLKTVCLLLAALLLFQLIRLVIRNNPLEPLRVPELPTLHADGKGTNSVSGQAAGKTGTNSVASQESGKKATNSVPSTDSGTKGTNSVAGKESRTKGTNSGERQFSARAGPDLGPGQPPKPADLPPVIQARVDKITLSELLAPIRTVPMALLGIAGKHAFLRAPNGQTGMVKEGDELGGVKLLRIGVNRVLIEQEGEKKELTIFSGLGSESLLPKQKESTNEIITKPK